MIHLSKRLEMIASICQPATVLADVGCDHAYLSIYMVLNGKAEKSIAMDLRQGPLNKAAENIIQYKAAEKVELRLSDGLEQLGKNEADAVLISGMGGILICDILGRGLDKIGNVKQLILQPQSDFALVRHFLHNNGWVIDAEKMCIDDGKFYTCIHVIRGEVIQYENEYEYEYGRLLLENKDETLASYLNMRLEKVREIISFIEAAGSEKSEDGMKRALAEQENLIQALKVCL